MVRILFALITMFVIKLNNRQQSIFVEIIKKYGTYPNSNRHYGGSQIFLARIEGSKDTINIIQSNCKFNYELSKKRTSLKQLQCKYFIIDTLQKDYLRNEVDIFKNNYPIILGHIAFTCRE